MEALVYAGVDIFALISGYCSYTDDEKPVSFRRFPALWGQVLFYSLGITIIWKLCGLSNVSNKYLVQSLLPVTSSQYWYFTAYAGVFFLSPFLIEILRKQSEKCAKDTSAILLILFSFYATAVSLVADPLRLRQGHGFLWLAVLFYIGGTIRKTDLFAGWDRKSYFKYIVIGCGLTGLSRIAIHCGTELVLHRSVGEMWFYKDISPLMVLIAVGFLGLFSSMRFKSKTEKLIKVLSSGTFGVYLLHVHPLVFENAITGRFTWLAEKNLFVLLGIIIGVSLLILTGGIIIDLLRQQLCWLTRINKLLEYIGTLNDKIWYFLSKRVSGTNE